jgi:sugar lactone lactonase YvrE
MRTSVRRLTATVALVVDAELGEGPVWDSESGRLVWVDIYRGAIHRFDPVTGLDRETVVSQPVGAVALRAGGGLVVAAADGFALLDDGDLSFVEPRVCPDPTIRMNDGKVDPAGRFWAGSMADDETPGAGALFRLATDLSVDKVLSGMTIPNGLDWSPDGTTMYVIDSMSGGVDQFRYDPQSGAIGDRRRLVDIAESLGLADGMTIDAEGCLWVAIWSSGEVRRYSPGGDLLAIVEVSATGVTSCAFGGPDLGDLYITTCGEGVSDDERRVQRAGSVFRCRPGVTGRQPNRFGG